VPLGWCDPTREPSYDPAAGVTLSLGHREARRALLPDVRRIAAAKAVQCAPHSACLNAAEIAPLQGTLARDAELERWSRSCIIARAIVPNRTHQTAMSALIECAL